VRLALGIVALLAWPAASSPVRESLSGAGHAVVQIGQPADSALDASVRAVASELRCPVCQGESIEDSPAGLAQEMRAIVREQLAAGKTPDEVKAYFAGKYGEWILLQPRASGWNLIVYVLPVAALLAGIAVVVRLTRRWALPGAVAPTLEAEGRAAGAQERD
jgi:cytochrome c-type biogenesis protein CcmH